MPTLENQISTWRNQMLASGVKAPVPLDELESHLRDEISRHINSGMPEATAFALAAKALGDGRTLRPEFAKVNHHFLWIYRDNPLPLKILAASFILAGLDPIVTGARVAIEPLFHGEGFSINLTFLVFIAFWGLQIGIGLGLLRRDNSWRLRALTWSGLVVLLIGGSSLWAMFHPNSPWIQRTNPQTDFLFGIEVPFMFKFSLYLFYLVITGSGLYILNKASIRQLFQSKTAAPA